MESKQPIQSCETCESFSVCRAWFRSRKQLAILECYQSKQPIQPAPESTVLTDEVLKRDIADLIRQFMHSDTPVEECAEPYKRVLYQSAYFVMLLLDSHGYRKDAHTRHEICLRLKGILAKPLDVKEAVIRLVAELDK